MYASTDDILKTETKSLNKKAAEIVVTFDEAITIEPDDAFAFNVVMPAAVYNETISLQVYLDNNLYFETPFAINETVTYAPGKRYPTEEYNFPANGNPTTKTTAGTLASVNVEGTPTEVVAPVTAIQTIEEFEAMLDQVIDNTVALYEVETTEDVNDVYKFALARDNNGVAVLPINADVLALLNKYSIEGRVHFDYSIMNVQGNEDGIELNKIDFCKGMNITAGNVTLNDVTAEGQNIVISGEETKVTVAETTELTGANITVKAGKLVVNKANFINKVNYVTAGVTENDKKEVIAAGTVTVNADNTCGEHFTLAGGNLNVAEKVTVTWGAKTFENKESAGTITNNGTLNAKSTVPTLPAGVTLYNKGAVTGKVMNVGEGATVDTWTSLEVAENKGTIILEDATIKVVIASGNGTVNNNVRGKVTDNGDNVVYYTVGSLTNAGTTGATTIDKVSGINKLVVTGTWTVTSGGWTLNDLIGTIEFNGGGLNITNGNVNLDWEGVDVIVAADTKWSGRDASVNSVTVKSITILTDDKGEKYDFVIEDLNVYGYKATVADESALEKAVNAGGEITLSSDVTLESYLYPRNVDVTIDLGGYTLARNNDDGYAAIYAGKNCTLTIKNGLIATVGTAAACYGGNLVLENVDITTTRDGSASVTSSRGNGAWSLTMTNCKVKNTRNFCALSVTGDTNATECVATITSCEFDSDCKYGHNLHICDATANFDDCTLKSNTKVEIKVDELKQAIVNGKKYTETKTVKYSEL